jgi:hypothetical protein
MLNIYLGAFRIRNILMLKILLQLVYLFVSIFFVIDYCQSLCRLREGKNSGTFGTKLNSLQSACTHVQTHSRRLPRADVSYSFAYSAVPGLKPGNWLAWLRGFVVFLSTCRKMMGWYHKLCCNRFLPLSFQFINHTKIGHCKLCAESIIK